jgi:hypothetical protein
MMVKERRPQLVFTGRWGRKYYARHARGSPGSSITIPVNHTARTQRSTGKHASSRYKKPRANLRRVKAKIGGKGGNTQRTDRKKKAKVPISVNPKIQFTWWEQLEDTKGRCMEFHHRSQGKHVTL